MDAIVEAKREQLKQRMGRTSLDALRAVARMQVRPLPFLTHVDGWTAVIGQVRYQMPLTGDLSTRYDPAIQAQEYVAARADAVSVFTDTVIQRDGMLDLTLVSDAMRHSQTPVISMDYVLDEYNIIEARAAGASVVVLTSGIVPKEQLRQLTSVVHRNRMTAVVTVYNDSQLHDALSFSPQVIGVGGSRPTDYQVDGDLVRYVAGHVHKGQRVMIVNPLRTLGAVRQMAALEVDALTVSKDLMLNPDAQQEIKAALQPS